MKRKGKRQEHMRYKCVAGLVMLAASTGAALAVNAEFTDSVVQSGIAEVRACTGQSGDGQIECVASALQKTGYTLSSRRQYVPAARVFLDGSAQIRSALNSGAAPKEKVRVAKAALDQVSKTLLSSSGAEKTEFSKLTRVSETAKGVLKA